MSVELWMEGVIVEFSKRVPSDRAMIRSVGRNEVILADIRSGQVSKMPIATL